MSRSGTAKWLGLAAAFGLLAIVALAGITSAQTTEEGVANFYNDNFQGQEDRQRRSL